MNEAQTHNLLHKAWTEAGVLANYPEFIALVLSLVLAWGISRSVRSSGSLRSMGDFGAGGVKRMLFPLLGLLFSALSLVVLKQWFAVDLLRLAVSLFGSLALVRAVFYLLRQVFAPGSMLASFERAVALLVWLALAMHLFGLLPQTVRMLDEVNLHFGKSKFSLWMVLTGLFWIGVTLLVALWLGRVFERRLLRAEHLDANLCVAFSRLINAMLVVVGVLITLPLAGIDLTVLSFFGGALGVGLGIGLQKIASNYMSGFIILLERSVRLGDLVTADNFYGEVRAITARSVIVQSLDGREAIIPNEMFITQTVLNHSLSNRKVRLGLPVQISYASDLQKAMALMSAAACAQPRVLQDPAPQTLLVRFADSGIDLELGLWIDDPEAGQLSLRSAINLAIWEGFGREGIQIPYPQREIRLIADAQSATKPR